MLAVLIQKKGSRVQRSRNGIIRRWSKYRDIGQDSIIGSGYETLDENAEQENKRNTLHVGYSF